MRFCSRRAGQFFVSTLKEHKYLYPIHTHEVRDASVAVFHPKTLSNSAINIERHYSGGRKDTLVDNILKLVKHSETVNNTQEVPSSRLNRVPQKLWKSNKHIQQLLPHLYSEDGQLLPTVTIEKQLIGLTQIWELEEAVKVLKVAISSGFEPNSTIILDLLQQLANMGEVDCILDLYEFLKDKGLTTNLRFYHCLRDAYFNSGRIDEGVAMLRIIYHSTRDFQETDMFFTLLTTMIIKHFQHHLPLIESFVTDLEESDPPVPSARASLWRCFVLAEKFAAADGVLADHEHLKKMVPEQVTKIVQSPIQLDYNKNNVLQWLIHLPLVKAGLKASIFDMLIQHKSHEGEWLESLELLSAAMDQGMKVQQQTVQVFLTRFFGQLSPGQLQQFSEWANQLGNLKDTDTN
uniref:Pentacotripeptide-repeat region of PRORP domain-containing protein n=1 Tax=Arion vulgaris TaxID=1028688 RepID=A0A0B6ZJ32_9EUPU